MSDTKLAAMTMREFHRAGRHKELPSQHAVDRTQLAKGQDVEQEHVEGAKAPPEVKKRVARKITRDHLAEIPDYYDRLDEMEEKAKKAAELRVKSPAFLEGFDGVAKAAEIPMLTPDQMSTGRSGEAALAAWNAAARQRAYANAGVPLPEASWPMPLNTGTIYDTMFDPKVDTNDRMQLSSNYLESLVRHPTETTINNVMGHLGDNWGKYALGIGGAALLWKLLNKDEGY